MSAMAIMAIPGAAQAAGGDLADVAKCAVQADRGAAQSTLDRLPFDSSQQRVEPASLGKGAKCATAPLAASSIVLRGAIVEALYERDFGEFGMQPHRATGDFARLPVLEGDADTGGKFALAMCVARSNPVYTDKLLAAPVASTREDNVMAQLIPYFSACRAKGTDIKLTRREMRALIAHGAYATSVRYWNGEMHAIDAN